MSMSQPLTVNSEEEINLKCIDCVKVPLQSNKDDYDPHAHRIVSHPTTNYDTLVHLLKGSLGMGILAMPKAFRNAGYLSGLVNTILIGIVCTYGLHILVRSQYILCQKYRVPLLSYPVSMKMAIEDGPIIFRWFAPAATSIVTGFLLAYQIGACCVYIVFISENSQQLFDIWGHLDTRLYMLILLVPLIGLICIRNLKLLVPFSTAGTLATFVGLALVMYHITINLPLPSLSKRDPIGDITNFPLFFGTVMFAIESVGVVIALEGNMQTPKSFGKPFGVLNIGMAITILLYATVGFVGYWQYGLESKDSITLNLSENITIKNIVQSVFIFSIFVSYGLQSYVPLEIIWTNYVSKRFGNELKWEYVTRLTVVFITFAIAVLMPCLGAIISIVGAMCLSMLGITFPAIMEICVHWPDNFGKFYIVLWRNVLLMMIGIVGLVFGAGLSAIDIYKCVTAE